MTMKSKVTISEQLGIRYQNALVDVTADGAALVAPSGRRYPVQAAPRLAIDPEGTAPVRLVNVTIEPYECLELTSTEPSAESFSISIDKTDAGLVIENCDLSMRLPKPGLYAHGAPGPFAGQRHLGGDWRGESQLIGVKGHVLVSTAVESFGPALVQWRVSYRWGSGNGFDVRARWAAGADTVVVEETILADTDTLVEFAPVGPLAASAHNRGAGEGLDGLEPMTSPTIDGTAYGDRRTIGYLSHISYFNQWANSWAGFGNYAEELYVGIFTGWSSNWRNRGRVRIEVVQDDRQGVLVRFPMREGRRVWGLVLTSREAAFDGAGKYRHPLNRRKNHYADVPLTKQRHWVLNGPIEERRAKLFADAELGEFRDRLRTDPEIPRTLDRFLETADPTMSTYCASAIWAGDREAMSAAAPSIMSAAQDYIKAIAYGGYDRICISEGRQVKRLAYDFDALWAIGVLSEVEYRCIRRGFLALAYVFADPDYCRYEDFRVELDPPEEGVADAMRDEMGDSPVPPNFAAEFFTTTAVIAELFPTHEQHGPWRAFGDSEIAHFLDRWFESDGTYLESINYHNHCFNEMLCAIYPAVMSGRVDYLANPRFRGSFEHFLAMRMPRLATSLAERVEPSRVYAACDFARRSPLPADGNSGTDGNELDWGAHMGLGARLYARCDPAFARRMMAAWRDSGKPILDHEHPLLTLVALDPTIESAATAYDSVHRKGLGIVSRATSQEGASVWCLFRAGRATHHMDFDQGNIHLAIGDEVLLGDHGYHTTDNKGKRISGAHTSLHNTVSFGQERYNSSGYGGLEIAPEPTFVHLGEDIDYVVHPMTTTNLRRMDVLGYNCMLPIEPVTHTRHFLHVKRGYFVVWDTFEGGDMPSVFRLHPTKPMTEIGPGAFVAGDPVGTRLLVQFAQPSKLTVIENRQFGPLWSFASLAENGKPHLAVMRVQRTSVALEIEYDEATNVLRLRGVDFDETVMLPKAGAGVCPVIVQNSITHGSTDAVQDKVYR